MERYEIEDFKSRLFVSVIKASDKSDFLEGVPHDIRGDFAIIPRYILGDADDEGDYKKSAVVTHNILLNLGMDINSVIELARNNTSKLFPCYLAKPEDSLDDKEIDYRPDGIFMQPVYSVQYPQGINSMAALFCQPDIINNLSSLFGDDFLIFPISELAFYCIPISNAIDIEEYQSMVLENFDELKNSKEFRAFSEKILRFDHNKKELIQMDGSSFSLAG